MKKAEYVQAAYEVGASITNELLSLTKDERERLFFLEWRAVDLADAVIAADRHFPLEDAEGRLHTKPPRTV